MSATTSSSKTTSISTSAKGTTKVSSGSTKVSTTARKSQKPVKDEDTVVKTEDTTQKHIAIGIFVLIGVGIVLYAVYAYVAWKNGWFPFGDYVTIPPPTGIQPTATGTYDTNGTFIPYDPTVAYDTPEDRLKAAGYFLISEDQRSEANDKLNGVLYNNCAWYCHGQYLNGNGESTSAWFNAEQKPNLCKGKNCPKQNILKPAGDTSGSKKTCDCTQYVLPPPPPT